jgi:hypothetical protein
MPLIATPPSPPARPMPPMAPAAPVADRPVLPSTSPKVMVLRLSSIDPPGL